MQDKEKSGQPLDATKIPPDGSPCLSCPVTAGVRDTIHISEASACASGPDPLLPKSEGTRRACSITELALALAPRFTPDLWSGRAELGERTMSCRPASSALPSHSTDCSRAGARFPSPKPMVSSRKRLAMAVSNARSRSHVHVNASDHKLTCSCHYAPM